MASIQSVLLDIEAASVGTYEYLVRYKHEIVKEVSYVATNPGMALEI